MRPHAKRRPSRGLGSVLLSAGARRHVAPVLKTFRPQNFKALRPLLTWLRRSIPRLLRRLGNRGRLRRSNRPVRSTSFPSRFHPRATSASGSPCICTGGREESCSCRRKRSLQTQFRTSCIRIRRWAWVRSFRELTCMQHWKIHCKISTMNPWLKFAVRRENVCYHVIRYSTV